MRNIITVILVLFSFSVFAVEKGEFYRIPFGTHITVLNEDGINNSNDNLKLKYYGYGSIRSGFEFGDSCYVTGGSAVKVLAVKGDKGLVKYKFVGDLAIGNLCPSGTIYFIKTDTITELYTPLADSREIGQYTPEEEAEMKALKEEVRAMLAE